VEDNGGKKKSNEPPNADAGKDIEVLTMTAVQFSAANSTDPDGDIEEYYWDFGDYKTPGEQTSSEREPRYTYNFAGIFKVELSVTDDKGVTSTDFLNVTVLNRRPEVAVEIPDTANVYDIIYLNVTADDRDGYISRYEWDFNDDGQYDWFGTNTGDTTHFFKEPGIFEITLTVYDNLKATTILSHNITIIEIIKLPPYADAGANQTVPVGEVLLKGTGYDSDGSITLYEWDFDGDGNYDWSSDTTGIVTHEYSTEGIFPAKFRVTDDSDLITEDMVYITVNNSVFSQKVNAQIYIDWDTTFQYQIMFNNTINLSNLKVIITDIVAEETEHFDGVALIQIDPMNYSITSKLVPEPNHSIEVQVLYYDSLVGARAFDIVSEDFDYMGPDLDFTTVYDLSQTLEERDTPEAELLRMTSIGELTLEHSGELYYTSLRGTGIYYVLDEFDGGKSEMTIYSDNLWLNVTLQGSEIISSSISLYGNGTMNMVYEDVMELDMEILTVRMIKQNERIIDNYIYAEGTFTGSSDDPNSNSEIVLYGDVTFEQVLLGRGYHENWEGEVFDCIIQQVDMYMEGETGIANNPLKAPFKTRMINTTWSVDFEKYQNNTIYYEYISNSTVANVDLNDEGSDYPINSPQDKEPTTHITDALSFPTPRPRVLQGNDSIVLESEEGVRLRLKPVSQFRKTISGHEYDVAKINGEFLAGASGELEVQMIVTGKYSGLTVYEIENISWENESVIGESKLIKIL
jgi:PKD repeat protein